MPAFFGILAVIFLCAAVWFYKAEHTSPPVTPPTYVISSPAPPPPPVHVEPTEPVSQAPEPEPTPLVSKPGNPEIRRDNLSTVPEMIRRILPWDKDTTYQFRMFIQSNGLAIDTGIPLVNGFRLYVKPGFPPCFMTIGTRTIEMEKSTGLDLYLSTPAVGQGLRFDVGETFSDTLKIRLPENHGSAAYVIGLTQMTSNLPAASTAFIQKQLATIPEHLVK